jgi:hypothetical protein
MEKRFKMVLKVITMLCSFVACAGAADPPDLYIAPYLQNVTTNSITVMWETKNPVIGKVAYGQNEKLDHSATETTPVKIHEIHLTGLQENTAYNYQVQYDEKTLTPASFRTAPPLGTSNWRFVVYGDNRSNPDTHTKNVQQIMKLNPAIVINSGDLVASGTVYEQWKTQYFDPLRGLAEYVPVYTCLGNHERNADHYYNYTSVPKENNEVYYSFDYATAHIISLNSNSKDAPFELGEAQTEWLIKDLKANQDKQWTIVFFHHPLFRCHPTRGITPQRWVWQPIFEQYGVDLVVNGHDHYYQRTYSIGNYAEEPTRGVYHLISGGGGAGTYPIVPKIHAASRKQIHHVTVMDVQDDRIVGRAIDIDGNTFDAFVYDKQAPSSAEEFIAYEIYTLERDLGDAIRKLPVAQLSKKGVKIDQVIEVPNPFQVPIQMTFSWQGTNGWQVQPQQKIEMLQPGTPIRLVIKANGPANTSYPLPVAQLSFSKEDGEKAFRNDVVTFYPLKVSPDQTLRIQNTKKAPTVDGDLSDAAWKKAWTTDSFIDVQGSSRPMRQVKASMVKKDNLLYVAAQMEAPEGLTEKGYEGRDNSRAPRNDHFRVHIGVGDQAYTFLVTAHGAELDTKGRSTTENLKWNSTFKAVSVATENGWQTEMVIPLQDIQVEGQALRINLARRDVTANTECELSPTFGPSGLDHRVPMYQGNWEGVEGFATLQFK